MPNKDTEKTTVSNDIIRNLDTREDDDSRLGRASSDSERQLEDGTVLSIEERKLLLRREWKNDILPSIPNDSKYHYCWLSTTNQTDPIYRRLRMGYELVRREDLPSIGISVQNTEVAAEYEGLISVNEMVLSRIPLELYQELMIINHHERPLEEEEILNANAVLDEQDSEGISLGKMEGEGFKNLGKRVRRPTFI